jgi:hypothetical protein
MRPRVRAPEVEQQLAQRGRARRLGVVGLRPGPQRCVLAGGEAARDRFPTRCATLQPRSQAGHTATPLQSGLASKPLDVTLVS